MKIQFFGAAGEVTGSCHILEVGSRRVLLDCGMIQGSRSDEARNRDPFPFDAAKIDAVILSHAHIDHSGRLPLLIARGFRGKIIAQNATKDLCETLLRDSAMLHERDLKYENKRRARKGFAPLEPLYKKRDVAKVLARMEGYRYREKVRVTESIAVTFRDAGHILGSAICDIAIKHDGEQRRIIFSGDLGQYNSPILNDPATIKNADLVLMESTYGGRVHRDRESTLEELERIIFDANRGAGKILIPAFSIGRSQEILYHLGNNYKKWRLHDWNVFLDSPMAIEASEIYWDYPHLYDEDATRLRRKLNKMPKLKNLHLTRTVKESQVINRVKSHAIVIAGSGMCNGGRILHHLKHNLWKKSTQVVFTGYQAYGSLGRRIVDGTDFIKINGESIKVAAGIHTVGGLSAHGDQDDLSRWYGKMKNRPPVYLVHGEAESAADLKAHFEKEFSTEVTIARPGDEVNLAQLSPDVSRTRSAR